MTKSKGLFESCGRRFPLLVAPQHEVGRAAACGDYNLIKLSKLVALAVLLPSVAWEAQGFTFDTFGDGFWKIINQGNGNALVVNASGASQAMATNTAFEQQFELLYNVEDGTFRLRNHDSWLCIGALNGGTTPGTAVVTGPTYTGAPSQRWNFVDLGGGNYRIVNVSSGLALQTDNLSPAHVTLAMPSSNAFQNWHFAYQTHYPKKGTGRWVGQFGTGWGYDWGYGTGPRLPAQVVYAPMQWGNWNVDPSTYGAWHSTEKPIHLLGFNEPDKSSQANMTTAQATNRWPQLQAMNVPLVSPACANTFGGWLADFYNKITANGQRVDYTGVHWYANPDATGLMNHLHNAFTTWGRAVWLTEFSVVDWARTAKWSEQDNYRFLAEFLWMAEDNVWLKRYAIFLFTGTPSTNPWDANGHRSDFFVPGGALTPFGELYAAWDADRALHAGVPYLMQNLATSFRLTSAAGTSQPSSSSIRVSDSSTQWVLTSAPTSGHWYIVSLKDRRRLRYNGGVLDLASPATTSGAVEWSFNGPDSKGYYFIDNPAGTHSLYGSGTPPAVTWSMAPFGTVVDNTRWRFVKPYQPTMLPAPFLTTTVATGGNTLALSWPNDYIGWHLQGQTGTSGSGMGTNWVTVPGSTTTNQISFALDPAQASVFFRLAYP